MGDSLLIEVAFERDFTVFRFQKTDYNNNNKITKGILDIFASSYINFSIFENSYIFTASKENTLMPQFPEKCLD